MQMNRSGQLQDSQENPYPSRYKSTDQLEKAPGLLENWYQCTTPPISSIQATLEQRERGRRARLASTILLLSILALLFALPVSIANHGELVPQLSALGTCVLGLVINRFGKTYIAALIIIVSADLGFMVSILATPHGLNAYSLPTFDLLVITELMAVSLLPPWSVFPIGGAHAIFIGGATMLMPHSPEIARTLTTDGYGLIIRPIILQTFVAIIVFLWVRSSTRALARADHAEEIIALQNVIAQQKQELEEGVNQILQMHVQIANGDFNTQVPLPRDNMLWRIASSLNNLMARLQRLNRADYELYRVQETSDRLITELRHAKLRRTPVRTQRTETLLDPLLQELNGKRVE